MFHYTVSHHSRRKPGARQASSATIIGMHAATYCAPNRSKLKNTSQKKGRKKTYIFSHRDFTIEKYFLETRF